MRLRVLLPTGVLVDEEVTKVALEAPDGALALLERHADLVTAVAPGIVTFDRTGGREGFAAVGEGVLAKVGPEVLLSTRKGVRADELGDLRETIRERFETLDERERSARTALAKIEATFVHRFIEFEHGA